ncbi:MAG: hypothetical protein LBI99_02490 [Propionibacteriaceae bacterium]|jgi:predicted small lipoprotein YifL|nr:hypothetical protein [Propionibacteriaceae bacterium]
MRRLFAACAVIAALAMLAGCFSGRDGWMDLPEVKAEYEEAARSLTWPDGYEWRSADERYKNEDETEPTIYEAGYGTGSATSEWLCAWDLELLNAVNDNLSPKRDAAIAELAKLPTLPGWKHYDEGAQELLNEYLGNARLGDFSEIASYVEANC